MNSACRHFRSLCLKPVINSILNGQNDNPAANGDEDLQQKDRLENEAFSKTCKFVANGFRHYDQDKSIPINIYRNTGDFTTLTCQQIEGISKNGTFEAIDADDVIERTHIFESRFIHSIKPSDTGIRNKSRLLALKYSERELESFVTKALTVRSFTYRLVLSPAASFNNLSPHRRNITQANTQSRSYLECDIYIRPPSEMQLSPGKLLKVVKATYGILE